MRVRQLLLLGLLLVHGKPALAETGTSASTMTERKAEQPQIIFDEKRQVIRFLVDGKEVMQVDAHGLKVVGDITYGGTSTATGPEWVIRQMLGHNEAPASAGGARGQ